MNKFIIIDHSLRDLQGHHYEYDVSVAEAAARLGYEPIIVSHKSFPKQLQPKNIRVIPKFTKAWLGDSLINNSLLIFIFKHLIKTSNISKALLDFRQNIIAGLKNYYIFLVVTTPYLRNTWDKLASIILELPLALKHDIRKIIFPFKKIIIPFFVITQILWRLLPVKTLTWSIKTVLKIFREIYNILKAQIRKVLRWVLGVGKPVFAITLGKAIKKIKVTSEDQVFIHTLSIEQLEEILNLLNTCDHKTTPHFHILLRRDCNEPIVTLAKGIGLQACLNRFYDFQLWPEIVTFYTDTDELTQQHDALSPIRFITAPIPFRHEQLKERSQPKMFPEPINIVYLGDARTEKGYQYLPELVDALWLTHIQPGKVKFTIQSNFNLADGEQGIREACLKLEQYPSSKVCLIKEPMPPETYYGVLADADIVVIPYLPDCYAVRSSGILVESLAAGKPVVVPAGTWMAKQVDNSTARIYSSPKELPDVVSKMITNFDQFTEAALLYRQQWRQKHSPDALVKCLTARDSLIKFSSVKEEPSILYIIDAHSIVDKTGSGQVARNQLQYLSRCGYRVYGVFFFNDPKLSDEDFAQRIAIAKNVLDNFDLIESWFLRYKFPFTLNASKSLEYIISHKHNTLTLELELWGRSYFDIPSSLKNFLNSHKIDAVLLNYISNWSILKKLGLEKCPVICEMHDVQSHQYAIYNNRQIDNKEFKLECQLLDQCTVVLANNLKELEKIQELVHKPSLLHIPYIGRLTPPEDSDLADCLNLADVLSISGSERCQDIEQNNRLQQESSLDLLFVSSHHAPNIYSLKWFFHNIYLPYLADKGVTLAIAGNIMNMGDLNDINHPQVFITGVVENLRPLYAAAKLVILPVKMGAGFNIKTIEALSMGKPVVASSMALRGINFDRDIFPVFDNPEDYAQRILKLLANPELRLEQARLGFEMIQGQYDQTSFDSAMNEAFTHVLEEKKLTPSPSETTNWEPCLVEWSSELQRLNQMMKDNLSSQDLIDHQMSHESIITSPTETFQIKPQHTQHLLVPIDHPKVVQPNSSEYRYSHVEAIFANNLAYIEQNLSKIINWFTTEGLTTVPSEQTDDFSPFWNNGYFNGDDARIAYSMVCEYKPDIILEIGSGNSTKFFRKAIQQVKTPTSIISLDPEPRAEIDAISDQVLRQSVLEIDKNIFQSLNENDILFFDGSHLVFNGTDTTYFYLEILPLIKKGVLVHIHDIMLPSEYDDEFTRRQYNEQYMLANLLLNSSEWKPMLPVFYMYQKGLLKDGGVSFWMTNK
ncbi:glycosyltransferase [Calothrix rhizosoleniae]|uniref:glycosyltransferase n=1 Tax=Calothrix rhizosoleniae TaxID=888997 RepID=UPI000B49BE28|nr:glycosyltransferase [Calothrix rhizosoleniae]